MHLILGALVLFWAASAQWCRSVPDNPCPPAFSGFVPMNQERFRHLSRLAFVLRRSVVLSPPVKHDLHLELMAMAFDLHGVRVDLHYQSLLICPIPITHGPSLLRGLVLGVLLGGAMNPSSTGRSACHQSKPVVCPLCLDEGGSLVHQLLECPFSVPLELSAHSYEVNVTETASWATPPLAVQPQHETNTTILTTTNRTTTTSSSRCLWKFWSRIWCDIL